MADHQALLTALRDLAEQVFPAGSIALEPRNFADLLDNQGLLAATDYQLEELEFLQDRASYELVFLFKRVDQQSQAARDTLFADLESYRTLIQADPKLGGVARDCRVSLLNVQSGEGEGTLLGVVNISAVVVH